MNRSREEMLALAERCEAATAADFNLDCDIARAMGYHVPNPPTGGSGSVIPSPIWRYSQSLDAAMTLVPEGAGVDLRRCVGGLGIVSVYPRGFTKSVIEIRAQTPALALCAAALRTLARENDRG